jgi:chromosomal replication initiation ATPase DnaA
LGSDEFVDWIYERFLSGKKADRRELGGIKELGTGPRSVEEIGREVSREFGIEEEGLYRPRGISPARSLLIELCRVHLMRGMSLAEIGRRLGGISAPAISQNKKRLEKAVAGDAHLGEIFWKVSNRLRSKASEQ